MPLSYFRGDGKVGWFNGQVIREKICVGKMVLIRVCVAIFEPKYKWGPHVLWGEFKLGRVLLHKENNNM